MLNAYERRREHRQLLRRMSSEKGKFVKLMEIEHRMRSYENAYFDLFETKCKVRYCNGWYWIHHRKYRQSMFEEMIRNLLARKHEQELYNEHY